jgi:hypothetical protein
MFVALMLAYPANVPGGINRITLAAVDCKVANQAEAIASVGLPALDLDSNRKRLHESARCLHSVDEIKKDAEAIAGRIAQLADLYHGVLDATTIVPGGASLDLSAPIASTFKGEIEGWKFAVTPGRFDKWRALPDTFRAANAPAAGLDVPVPAAAQSMGAPPAPNTKAPPIPKVASRESRRKAAAQVPVVETPPAPVIPPADEPGMDDDDGEEAPPPDTSSE